MKQHAGTELAVDLALAQAMVKELEDYLLSDRLFYQLVVRTPSGDRQPKLTPGVLIETLSQLRWGWQGLSDDQRQAFDRAQADFEAEKGRMAGLWQSKVLAELNSLLNSWRWFMQDCEDRNPRCRSDYDSEVTIRARIQRLMNELNPGQDLSDVRGRLAPLDSKLSRVFRAGGFIWDPALEPHYPKEEYWFLYGKPSVGESW